jgi:hypothetical protein
VTCFPAESIVARKSAILGCAALATSPRCPYVIAEGNNERYLAVSAVTSWSRSTMGRPSSHPASNRPQTSGLRDLSAAPISAAGHSTVDTIYVQSRAIPRMKRPPTARYRQTSSPTAHAGKLHSLPCPWNQDNRVRIRSRTATSPAIRLRLVAICA